MTVSLIVWIVAVFPQNSLGAKSVVRTSHRNEMDSQTNNKKQVVRKVSISPMGMLEVNPSDSDNQLDAALDVIVVVPSGVPPIFFKYLGFRTYAALLNNQI